MTEIIHTEQVKLRAAYYNGVAITLVALGGFLAVSFLREDFSLRGVLVGFAVFFGMAVCSVALREIAAISLREIGLGD